MASLTGCAGWQVLHGLDHGRPRIVPSMAGAAILGCALEQALGMASFAAHVLVSAIEHKSGPCMIKICSSGLRLTKQWQEKRNTYRQDQRSSHEPRRATIEQLLQDIHGLSPRLYDK
jgi:hypothetical protein